MIEKLGVFYSEEVERLLDSFTACFGVRFTIFSPEFEDLIYGYPRDSTRYCTCWRDEMGNLASCAKQNRQGCVRSEKASGPLIYQCYAGVTEVAMPIISSGKLLGYAMIGQFRIEGDKAAGIPEYIALEAEKAGTADTLRRAWDELPLYSRRMTDNMVNLFAVLINFIVMREYFNVRQPGLTERITHWIDDHVGEPIELADIAAALGCSRSTISHTIKRRLGMSFKQLCTQKRIQRFEELAAARPELTIAEAAAKAGYEDPLYFSRLYKKLRRVTPSAYVKSVR